MMMKRKEAQLWLQSNFFGEDSIFAYCSLVFCFFFWGGFVVVGDGGSDGVSVFKKGDKQV